MNELVSPDRLQKALTYLAQTDEPAAKAKARMMSLDDQRKTVLGIEMLRASGNSNPEREANARRSEAYSLHVEKWENAVADYELYRNKRNTESLIVEVWRSVNANRRSGNI